MLGREIVVTEGGKGVSRGIKNESTNEEGTDMKKERNGY